MEILFLSRWFPYPPDNGAKIRIYNLLRELSACHTVDLISFREEAVSADQAAKLGAICRRVDSLPYRPFQPGGRRALTGFLSWQPRSVVDTYSAEFERRAQAAVSERQYDLVIASQIDMIPYAARLPIPRRVAEEIELTTLFDRAYARESVLRRLRGQLTWMKYSRYLRHMLMNFQGCSVVSE
ncbi:MAG TPA: hypothetical protein VHO48_14905, partial [Anaerolineaceae bacterium]|nr:hypothetical protein [Anaerolineaceae bacterium]